MMAVPCCWSSQRCLNFEPGSAIVRERRSLTERCCAPITENSSGKSTFPLLRAQIHSCFRSLSCACTSSSIGDACINTRKSRAPSIHQVLIGNIVYNTLCKKGVEAMSTGSDAAGSGASAGRKASTNPAEQARHQQNPPKQSSYENCSHFWDIFRKNVQQMFKTCSKNVQTYI